MHGCPSRLGPYLEVECMNRHETNFSRTTQSQRFWQGAIWHVWTSQFDKHWRHSQKERLAYKLVDINHFYLFYIDRALNRALHGVWPAVSRAGVRAVGIPDPLRHLRAHAPMRVMSQVLKYFQQKVRPLTHLDFLCINCNKSKLLLKYIYGAFSAN